MDKEGTDPWCPVSLAEAAPAVGLPRDLGTWPYLSSLQCLMAIMMPHRVV